MTETKAPTTYDVRLRTVSKWIMMSREGGMKELNPGKRGRRPSGGRLNATQAERIRVLIVGKMPDKLKLPF